MAVAGVSRVNDLDLTAFAVSGFSLAVSPVPGDCGVQASSNTTLALF